MSLPTVKPTGKYYEICKLLMQLPEEWIAEFLKQTEGTDSTVVLSDVWPSIKDPDALLALLRSNQ